MDGHIPTVFYVYMDNMTKNIIYLLVLACAAHAPHAFCAEYEKFLEFTHRPMEMVMALALTRDGEYLVSGHEGGEVCVWDLATRQQLTTFPCITPVAHIVSTRDSNKFIIGTLDNTIHTVDIKEQTHTTLTEDLGDHLFSLAATPDGEHILYGYRNGILRLSNTQTGESELLRDGTAPEWISCITITPDNRKIIAGIDNKVHLFNRQTREQTVILPGNYEIHQCNIAVNSSGNLITLRKKIWAGEPVGRDDRIEHVHLWDISVEPRKVRNFQDPLGYGAPTCLTFTPDDKHILIGWRLGDIGMHDVSTGNVVASFRVGEEHSSTEVYAIVCNPLTGEIISGDSHGKISGWRPKLNA